MKKIYLSMAFAAIAAAGTFTAQAAFPEAVITPKAGESISLEEWNQSSGDVRLDFGTNAVEVNYENSGNFEIFETGIDTPVYTFNMADTYIAGGPDWGEETYHWDQYAYTIETEGSYTCKIPAGAFKCGEDLSPAYEWTFTIGKPDDPTVPTGNSFALTPSPANGTTYDTALPSEITLTSAALADLDKSAVKFNKKATFAGPANYDEIDLTTGPFWGNFPGFEEIVIAVPQVESWEAGTYEFHVPAGAVAFEKDGKTYENEDLIFSYTISGGGSSAEGAPKFYPADGSDVKTLKNIVVYFPDVEDDMNWRSVTLGDNPVIKDGNGNELKYELSIPTGDFANYTLNGMLITLEEEVTAATTVTVEIPANFLEPDFTPYPEAVTATFHVTGGVPQPDYVITPDEAIVNSLSQITLNVTDAESIIVDPLKQAQLVFTGAAETIPDPVSLTGFVDTDNPNIVNFEVPYGTELIDGYWQFTVPAEMLTIKMPAGEVKNVEIKKEFNLVNPSQVGMITVPDNAAPVKELTTVTFAFPEATTFAIDEAWEFFGFEKAAEGEGLPDNLDCSYSLATGEYEGKGVTMKITKPVTEAGTYTAWFDGQMFLVNGAHYSSERVSVTYQVDGEGSVSIIGVDGFESEYFDLNGVRVANPEAGQILIRCNKAQNGKVSVEKVVVK